MLRTRIKVKHYFLLRKESSVKHFHPFFSNFSSFGRCHIFSSIYFYFFHPLGDDGTVSHYLLLHELICIHRQCILSAFYAFTTCTMGTKLKAASFGRITGRWATDTTSWLGPLVIVQSWALIWSSYPLVAGVSASDEQVIEQRTPTTPTPRQPQWKRVEWAKLMMLQYVKNVFIKNVNQ